MAALTYFCLLFLICVNLTHGAVDNLCNDEFTDCDAGECCAHTVRAPSGFTGVCQKYKTINHSCTPGGPKDGECGCPRWMICAKSFSEDAEPESNSCQVILPGR